MDQETFVRHCIQAVLLVSLGAPTTLCAQGIWRGGAYDTERRRTIFRGLGAFLVAIIPSILVQYIAPEKSGQAAEFGIFAAGAWLFFSLRILLIARRLFGPKAAAE